MNLNKLHIKAKSISDVEKKKIFNFYRNNYSKKLLFLKKNWKWLYRVNFSKKNLPHVLLKHNHVVSHSGSIPFHIKINKKNYLSSWFVDFSVVKKYQRMNLGTELAKIWMKKKDIGVTFCNKRSLKIFKKHNWKEKNNFFMFLVPLRPFDYPKINYLFKNNFGNLLNIIFFKLFLIFNRFDKNNITKICFLNVSLKTLNKFRNTDVSNEFTPLRDVNYFKWRVIKSPFKKKYMIIKLKKNYFLVKKNKIRNVKFLEILLKQNNIKSVDFRNSLISIYIWAFKKNYSYIKFMTNKEKIKKLNLFFILKRKLNFAFFSKKKLNKKSFNFDLIDSDFEFTNK